MDLGLKDKSAVVLASSAGLGLAVAGALLDEGARVAVSGRDPERLAAARESLAGRAETPGHLFAEALDVTDGQALCRHLDRAASELGQAQVLITNAGGPAPGTASQVTSEGLAQAFELTLHSAVRAIQHVLPGMRAAGWGRIVALTSIAVRQPIGTLAYSNVMRSGLTAWLKTLAGEVAGEGVLVNSVCTGLFRTERLTQLFAANAERKGISLEEEEALQLAQVPQGRLGDPAEFGELVAFLASERCSYLNGVALPIDGGMGRGLL